MASVFNDYKYIWTTSEGIIVLSWVATGSNNINNYTLRAFNIPATGSITLIGSISGQYYESTPINPPTVSVSSTLNTIVIYAKLSTDSAKFASKGISISFTAKTIKEFTIPTWITAT